MTSPEGTPARPTLADVDGRGRLLDEPADLLVDGQLLAAREVSAPEFVAHALEGVDGLLVDLLHLLLGLLRAAGRLLDGPVLGVLELLGLAELDGELLHDAADDLVLDVLLGLEVVLLVHLLLLVRQPPADYRVLRERLQHPEQALLVLPQDLHHHLAGHPEQPVDARNPHRLLQHPRQPERDLLRELLAQDCHLEAVAEVDVDDLAGVALEHDVGGVSVAEAENVADHGHGGQAAGVVVALLHPHLAVGRLEAEDLLQVLALRRLQSVLEDLQLVDNGQVGVVGAHLLVQLLLHIDSDLVERAILLDQLVERVAVLHPADESGVDGQRDDRVAGDLEVALQVLPLHRQQLVDQAEELHHPLVQPQVLPALQQEVVLLAVAAQDGQLARPLLGLQDDQFVGEAGDLDAVLAGEVQPGDGGLVLLAGDEEGRDVLEVDLLDVLEGVLDLLVDGVEGLEDLRDAERLVGALEPQQPAVPVPDLLPELLVEGHLAVGLVALHHVLAQLLQQVDYLRAVPVLVVDGPGRLDAVVPVLLELDGRAAQLVGDLLDLAGQLEVALLDEGDDLVGGPCALGDLALGREVEREEDGLGVLAADVPQQHLQQLDEVGLLVGLEQLRDHLRHHVDPPLNWDLAVLFRKDVVDASDPAVVAEQGEQLEVALQVEVVLVGGQPQGVDERDQRVLDVLLGHLAPAALRKLQVHDAEEVPLLLRVAQVGRLLQQLQDLVLVGLALGMVVVERKGRQVVQLAYFVGVQVGVLLEEAFNLEYRLQLLDEVVGEVDFDFQQVQQFLLLLVADLPQFCLDLADELLALGDVLLPDVDLAELVVELEVLRLVEQQRAHDRQVLVGVAVLRAADQPVAPDAPQLVAALVEAPHQPNLLVLVEVLHVFPDLDLLFLEDDDFFELEQLLHGDELLEALGGGGEVDEVGD